MFIGLEGSGRGFKFRVEVADGHIVKCTARGIVEINMIADDGLPFKANLHGVIYVPGLKRCLFSVTAFTSRGHYAIVKKNEIQLMWTGGKTTHLDAQEWYACCQQCHCEAIYYCS